MPQLPNAAPGARVSHAADRRDRPAQMTTTQVEGARPAADSSVWGQMAAAQPDAPHPTRTEPAKPKSAPRAFAAAFGTGTGAAIVFHDLASI